MEVCKLLIDKGADVNLKGVNEDTPLVIACEKGHLSICQLLIDKGANIDSSNLDGFTPLYWAIVGDSPKIC